MSLNSRIRTNRALRIAALVAGVTGLATAFMSWQSIERERHSGVEDLQRRADILATRISAIAPNALAATEGEIEQALRDAVSH